MDQARVGGHSVEQTFPSELADIVNLGSVGEELHGLRAPRLSLMSRA
jgi:hypothetical protein